MKGIERIFVWVMVLIMLSCGSEKSGSGIVQEESKLDSVIDNYVENGSYPFLYLRMESKNGDLLYEHAAVNRELIPEKEINGDTWIRIWSMSKIVTISIVLDLVEEGVLSLDDPVTKYIPEFKDLMVAVTETGVPLSAAPKSDSLCPYYLERPDSVMTVRHLINHQSGFYYATTGIPCLDSELAALNLPESKNTDEFLRKLATMPLILNPGSSEYYGTNTTVLGMVAERATSRSLKILVEERLTDFLGIAGLQYSLPESGALVPPVSGRDSVLRWAKPGELDIFGPDVVDYDPDHKLYLGGEGMLATAAGYADFLRMMLAHGTLNGKRYLEEASVRDMYAPHTNLNNAWGHNGYNLWVTGDSARLSGQGDAGLWQGGGYEGTSFWVDPKREFVAVIMTQMYWIPTRGYGRDAAFRGELYKQIFENEAAQ